MGVSARSVRSANARFLEKIKMSLKKRLGYNWKARQQKPTGKRSREKGGESKGVAVELDDSLYGRKPEWSLKSPLDTNIEVVLPKRPKLSEEEGIDNQKRKKLNAKQRKRLLKVVEAKEKKAKVTLFKAHHTWEAEHLGI